MFEALLATTSSEGLRALGQREQRSYELITDAVRSKFGPRHAALFGEFVATAHGDHYDWYSPVAGKARRLDTLGPAELQAARQVLEHLSSDIAGEAERLRNNRSLDDLRLGEALANALRVPDDSYVYVIETSDGPQPVLVNWAWVSDEQSAVRGVLTGTANRPKAASSPAVASAVPTGGAAAGVAQAEADTQQRPRSLAWLWWLIGLGWLLLAILLTIIVLLLVRPCALNFGPWFGNCPASMEQASPEAARFAELQSQIASIERQIAEADRACQPALPLDGTAEEAVSAIDPELAERMERSGATRGELTFTLVWDTVADLDLHVTCPQGAKIWYRQRNACNGYLDVDSNAGGGRADPIENVYFETPDAGTYDIMIDLYAVQGSTPTQDFRLTIQDGDETQTMNGTLSPGATQWSTTYQRTGQL